MAITEYEKIIKKVQKQRIQITNKQRIEIANIFRAHIVDVANESVVIEATGDQGKISALSNMLEPYGIKEVIRTGITALERGEKELKN